MDRKTIETEVVAALVQIAPEIDAKILDPKKNFRDQYQLDSIDFLNLVMKLEKKLEIKIPEIDYPKLSSLDGCVRYISASPHE